MRQDEARPKRQCPHRRHEPRSLLRRALGWTMIGLALLGFVMPLLPGVIFLGLGIVLLGPHDPTLRQAGLWTRLLLRRWSHARQPHLRSLGQFARQRYRATRLALREHLRNHARRSTNPRWALVLLTVTLIGVAVAASAVVLLWHTVL
ncbi:MAG: hypothetical protein M3R24_16805 [Chloroflexota bacterium]|nr:hypothetical protein [Chloroflexota bacterium]